MVKSNSIKINVLEELKEEPPRLRKSLTRSLYVTLLRICLAEAKPLFPHEIERRLKKEAPSTGKYLYGMIKELAPEPVESTHIFAWDMVPGRHSKKLIQYLYRDLKLSWLKKLYLDESIDEYITKSLDKQMISVSYGGHTINLQKSDLNKQVSLSIPGSNTGRSFETRIVKGRIHAYQRVIFVGPRISYLDAVSIRNRRRPRDMNSEKNSNRGTRRMQLVYVPNFRGFVLYLIGEKNVDRANHILAKLSRRMEYRALLNGRLSFDKIMRHGTKNNGTSYSAVLLKNTAMDFANRLDDTLLDNRTLRYQFTEGYLARLTPYVKGSRQGKTLNSSLQNQLLKYKGNLVRYLEKSKERLVS